MPYTHNQLFWIVLISLAMRACFMAGEEHVEMMPLLYEVYEIFRDGLEGNDE